LSTPFQNRLVGSSIVAAVIIIFLPGILDGKKKSDQDGFEPIPQTPAFIGNTTKKPFPEQKLIIKKRVEFDKKDKQEQAVETKIKVTPSTKVKPVISSITKPKLGKQPAKAVNKEAWVIQLGSFRHRANVNELLAKLKKNGYVAFTKPIKTKKGTLIKVLVGPELIKSSLIKKLPALKKLTNVQGRVAQFYPTK